MEDFDETKYAMGSLAGRQSSERDMDVEDIKGAELEGIEGEMEGPGTRNLHEPDKTFRDMLGRGRNAPPKQREEGLMIQVDKSTLTPLTKKLSNRLPVVQEDEAIVAGSVPHKCHGCGVVLQTEDANKVGFRPPHVLNIETKGGQAVCQRCYALRHSGRVIPIRVPFAELKDHLRVLSTMPVLVVKIVDIFDFSGSFIPDFHFIVGNNPVILVGNKVDLLPDGASDERVRTWLKKLSKDLGLRNVRAVHLISALTGAGISDLSRRIEQVRQGRDVYIVGCTNVGKSTLINQLLRKTKGPKHRLITTSIIPGTTLNLISFPIGARRKHEALATLYDTPGIVNEHQIANLLTTEELKATLPHKKVRPCIYRLMPGKTLFFGALGRLDYLQGPGPVYLSLYLSSDLVLHGTAASRADEIFEKHAGRFLKPPFSPERIQQLPPLAAKEIILEAREELAGLEKSFADIVYSGLGWASVAAPVFDRALHFRTFAPAGTGIFVRDPLMPFDIGARAQHRVTHVGRVSKEAFQRIVATGRKPADALRVPPAPGYVPMRGKGEAQPLASTQEEEGAQPEEEEEEAADDDMELETAHEEDDEYQEDEDEEEEGDDKTGSRPLTKGGEVERVALPLSESKPGQKKRRVTARRQRRMAFLRKKKDPKWRAAQRLKKAKGESSRIDTEYVNQDPTLPPKGQRGRK